MTKYLPLVLFPIFYLAGHFYYRSPPVKASEMDFVSDIAQIEADMTDDPPPKNKMEAFWQWLVSDHFPVMLVPFSDGRLPHRCNVLMTFISWTR